ncbi:Ras guanine nucleotide exchange factor J [Psilocybe cubensis]|uniref:Ras guanine nucleotide exchange factor J n=2 Tax=Psilocybe cubensis TaxID=181762 RepID=A0ACB8GKW6_PSICU|nr:Ras guanine nucleotide exchange factor J [Psilocybe cubensis]KAH9476032.1 Ras guanine nucleotide exchange factor J [Psilocybe cubensis]
MATQLYPIPEQDDEESRTSILTVSYSSDYEVQSPTSSPNTSNGELIPNSPSSSSLNRHKEISDLEFLSGDVEIVNGEMVGATEESLVARLISLRNPALTASFFLTFRLYCSPSNLAKHIDTQYKPQQGRNNNIHPLESKTDSGAQYATLEFIFTWLKEFWLPTVDDPAFPTLTVVTSKFLIKEMSPYLKSELLFPVLNLLNLRIQGELNAPGTKIQPRPHVLKSFTDDTPKRRITRALLTSLRKKDFAGLLFINFDALELARQLTLMESELYCAISQQELLNYFPEKPDSSPNIKALVCLSDSVRHWVSESILHELNIQRRAWLIGFFIEIADKCIKLHNFNTSRSIISALDSPVISRLYLAQTALREHSKDQFNKLKKFPSFKELYNFGQDAPSVPFLGLYLSSVIFYRDLYSSHRPPLFDSSEKLIDLNKHSKLAEILEDFRRFQVPYNLKPIPELQFYLKNVAFKVDKHLENIQILGDRINKPHKPSIQITTSLQDRKRKLLEKLTIPVDNSQTKDSKEETTPTQATGFDKHQSLNSNYSSSVGTIYSNPHSSIGTLDYGAYYTRHAISQDSLALAGWQWKTAELESDNPLFELSND